MSKLYKGWLKTRDGGLFSPNSLSDNIYTKDGSKYDDVIQKYIGNVQNELDTHIVAINERLKNFDGSDSD